MRQLTIDGRGVEVPEGATILDAAREAGIEIPTLCFREGYPPLTSCMVCLVKVDGNETLLPACGTVVRDGMRVESETDEVHAARRAAFELLLGEHLGDCVAPCSAACPAHLNVPAMIRHVQAGHGEAAAAIAGLCTDCGARCEKVCRRAAKDAAVSIRNLVRFAASAGDGARRPPHATAEGYSVHVGRVPPEDIDAYLIEASGAARVEPADGEAFTEDEARSEAARCMHCDCRAAADCRLRDGAAACRASATKYRGKRRPFEQHVHPQGIVYEPGKCIACGLCIQVAKESAEPLGLTFVGRGFDVRVAVPFSRPLEEGLQRAAAACVRACPTGALAFRDNPEER